MKKWQKRLIQIVTGVVIIILITNLGMAFYLNSQINKVRHTHLPCVEETPLDWGFNPGDYQNISFQSLDGLNLVGIFFPVEHPKAVIVVSHGAADRSCAEFMLPLAKPLVDQGYSVMLITLRNYGQSEGNLTSFGRQEWQDVAGAVVWVENQAVGVPIYLMGISMGGATVLTAASQGYGQALVLLVPYTRDVPAITWRASQQTGIPENLFLVPATLAVWAEWGVTNDSQPFDYAGQVEIPTLIIGGRRDHILPPREMPALQQAIGNNAQLVWTEGRHNLVREDETVRAEVIQYTVEFFNQLPN